MFCICIAKVMVFLVVLSGCESWIIKKTEWQRIDAFGLWCWRRLLRVPWTAGRSNQSILKEISSEYSLEGLMLKKCSSPDVKNQLTGRDPDAGKIEGKRGRGWHGMRWLGSITGSMDISLSKLQEMVKDRGAQSAAIHGVAKSWTWWSNWKANICFESEKKWHLESAQYEAALTALLLSNKITGSRATNCIVTYLPSSLKGEGH